MKQIRICLCGSTGRMGKEFLALDGAGVQFVARLDRGGISSQVEQSEIDVILDFSTPEGFDGALAWAIQMKKAFVSGTTGLTDAQFKKLAAASTSIPVLWSSNMSPGVNILLEMLDCFRSARGFDFQIDEIHHKKKKDAPSGTAKAIKARLDQCIKKETPPVLSTRGGGVFGIHRVMALSEEEILSIEHTALNRTVFAKGALLAARWIVGRPAGEYKMRDVLAEESVR